jgi:hypothetical protein
LDLFGFPWILSSESRLINALREIFAEKFFLALYPLSSHRRGANHRFWKAKAQKCSWGELNSISDFPQDIVVQAVPSTV